MARLSSGRATILGALVVNDIYGTAMVLSANTAGSAFKPDGAIGCLIYSPNVAVRMRCQNHASTAISPH